MSSDINALPANWQPFHDKILATIKPTVALKLKASSTLLPWQSKVGGTAYLPQEAEYPVTANGEALFLLAQINFAEMPALENYPNQGILQFFIAADDIFGLNFDDPQNQDSFRVIYHANVIEDISQLNLVKPELKDDEYLPFTGEYTVEFATVPQAISTGDFGFGEKIFGVKQLYDYEEEFQGNDFYDDMIEPYNDVYPETGHRIGGYPYFTQEDPRSYREQFQQYELLFQLDTDDQENDIMWGDCGVGNFFIHPEDLKNLDFSKVLYNWDCC